VIATGGRLATVRLSTLPVTLKIFRKNFEMTVVINSNMRNRGQQTKVAASQASLEVILQLPTGQQQSILDDTLRLLASWAIRAAREAKVVTEATDLSAPSALTSGRG
jgi:hypothetical protein